MILNTKKIDFNNICIYDIYFMNYTIDNEDLYNASNKVDYDSNDDEYDDNNDNNDKNDKVLTIDHGTFDQYIKKRKCDKSVRTHQLLNNRLMNNSFSFKIDDNEYDEFLNKYIKECDKNYGRMNILEKPMELGPLYFDFDLKTKYPQRMISISEISDIVETINEVILSNFKLTNNSQLKSYIMMKNKPFFIEDKNIYSDGFHIHYPNLILNVSERYLVFDESKKQIINKLIFSEIVDINSPDINNIYDEIFDKCVIKTNSWYLYGSGKNNKLNNKLN